MKSVKKVFRYNNSVTTQYKTPNGKWHRKDGPAYVYLHTNGEYIEEWWYNNFRHRYGGPALENNIGLRQYYVHGKYVSDEVHEWLNEHGYVWDTMSDIEKWDLELFMRSL